ncbi:hypothetical protein C7B62_03220 [Pleurocapsa sp. CCALA 161]|uniref:hypothetical protein n=1 Tax=Pleurocapsa sp. CCALA 161 TaxID=2107688 RepID=UPI000D064609|nr:hypothetical protein [Pleurocapsa sp. CCALA 161]PSB12079.1 hypothetical protein C7B62_03220 [Pleurocapsa sp. CCALA 161]
MSTIAAWQCLYVQEFISQCNWENTALPASATSVSISQSRKSLASWQCLTTQDFFALSNWSGTRISLDPVDDLDHLSRKVVFDITLPSGQFWQCFNWSGVKETPAPQKIEQILEQTKEAIAEVEEFTLNDLSQLF